MFGKFNNLENIKTTLEITVTDVVDFTCNSIFSECYNFNNCSAKNKINYSLTNNIMGDVRTSSFLKCDNLVNCISDGNIGDFSIGIAYSNRLFNCLAESIAFCDVVIGGKAKLVSGNKNVYGLVIG